MPSPDQEMNANYSPPWSILSTQISSSMPVQDILRATSADYEVVLSPVQVENVITGKFSTVKDRFVTGRVDRSSGLMDNWEVVKGRYEVVPNSVIVEKSISLCNHINKSERRCVLDRAGILDNGRKFFTSIQLDDIMVCGDIFKNHIIVMTSHDGSSPITYYFVNARAVTNTIYRIPTETTPNFVKKKHTPNTESWNHENSEVLDAFESWQTYFNKSMQTLKSIDFSNTNINNVLNDIWSEEDADTSRKLKHREEVVSTVMRLYNAEYNSERFGRNGLGMFSAISDYYDNYRNVEKPIARQQSLELDNFVHRKKIEAYKAILEFNND